MVIGRSDEQQNPPDSMALTTPRECLVLLGGTHLGQRLPAARTGRTHDRNRIEHQTSFKEPLAPRGPSTHESEPLFHAETHVRPP